MNRSNWADVVEVSSTPMPRALSMTFVSMRTALIVTVRSVPLWRSEGSSENLGVRVEAGGRLGREHEQETGGSGGQS